MTTSKNSSRKLLPRPGDEFHLSDEGYSTLKSKVSRQRSLSRSSKKHGSLTVMRRLNLIRNLSRENKSKSIMKEDVEYMKRLYSKEKRKVSKKGSKKSSKRSTKKSSRRKYKK